MKSTVVFGYGLAGVLLGAFAACTDRSGPPLADLGSVSIPDRIPLWTDSFAQIPCWPELRLSGSVQCGYLTVPEDHDDPGSPTIELAVTRYFSYARDVQPDPVVYLEGGPGGSGTLTMTSLHGLLSWSLVDRDIITLDQRGTGLSKPSLACADILYSAGDDDMAWTDRCRKSLDDRGIDIAQYNSRQNALDVEALRLALGYVQWNLYGISYGTRLALTVMRDHPDGVRSAILDSSVPLEIHLYERLPVNAQNAFEALFEVCADIGSCASMYPDLMRTLIALLDRLDQDPYVVPPNDELLDGNIVLQILFWLLYDSTVLAYIPGIIDDMDKGDFSLMIQILEFLSDEGIGMSYGMHLSVNCSEEVAWFDVQAFDTINADVHPRFRDRFGYQDTLDICSVWDVPPSAELETQAVRSSIPALVMAGTFDPITPPLYGQMVHENLSHSHYYEFRDGSHGVSVGDCGLLMLQAFLTDPGKDPRNACLDTLSIGVFYQYQHRSRGSIRFAMPDEPFEVTPEVLRNLARRASQWPHPL